MNDVADILQTGGAPSPSPEGAENVHHSSKASGGKKKKPKGMSREVFALATADASAAAAIQAVADADEVPKSGRKFKIDPSWRARPWQWSEFSNSARTDNLKLKHWQRKPIVFDEYPFARFNKPSYVVSYTDEIYEKALTNAAWTREETDTLTSLCRRFDCRWPLVYDRWPSSLPPRTVTELRTRYFAIAKTLVSQHSEEQLLGARPVDPRVAKLVLQAREAIKSLTFDPADEDVRKQAADADFRRTKQDGIAVKLLQDQARDLAAELRKLHSRKRELEEKKAAIESRSKKSTGKRLKQSSELNVENLESSLATIFTPQSQDIYLRSEACLPLLLGPNPIGKGAEIVRVLGPTQSKFLGLLLERDAGNEPRSATNAVETALAECWKDAIRLIVYEHGVKRLRSEGKQGKGHST